MALALPPESYSEIDAALSRAFVRGLERTRAVDQFSARLLVFSNQVSSADSRLRLPSSERYGAISRLIVDSVKTSIASLLRAENARRSLCNALPPELWCSVWSFLPFATRIAVSHTCSKWRSISVGCPELWTHLTFYVTAHATDCRCLGCNNFEDDGGEHPSGWYCSPYPEDSSNVSLAGIVLCRSAGVPLFLTVHIAAYNEQRELLSELASSLYAHRHRVQGLDIRAAELLAARRFMESVADWPSLRNLTMGQEPNDVAYPEVGCIMLHNAILLPQITSARFLRQCIWPDPSSQQSYHTLRSMDVQPAQYIGHELLSILTSCRHLDALRVDLYPTLLRPLERSNLAEISTLASVLRSVSVRRLGSDYEDYILDIFELQTRPSLALEYERREDIARGRDIFRDLTGALDLHVSFGDGLLSLHGTDTAGRTRRLALCLTGEPTREEGAAVLSSLAVLSPADVRSIAIDGSLWPHLIECAPEYASLVSLEIVVNHSSPPPPIAGNRPSLPALQSLTLLSHRGVVRHSARAIEDFIRSLQLPMPIPLLRVDHRLVLGSSDSLRNVAHTVSVGVYHVEDR